MKEKPGDSPNKPNFIVGVVKESLAELYRVAGQPEEVASVMQQIKDMLEDATSDVEYLQGDSSKKTESIQGTIVPIISEINGHNEAASCRSRTYADLSDEEAETIQKALRQLMDDLDGFIDRIEKDQGAEGK